MSIFLPRVVKLVSIDPGSEKCGVSIFTIDFINRKILHIESFTICVSKLTDDTGFPEDLVPNNVRRYYKLRNEISRILTFHQPLYVAYEGPFMNTKFKNAFGPLVSVMTLVHDAVVDYRLGCPFMVFQPTVVKMAVEAASAKGKEHMVAAIKKIDEIMAVLVSEIDELDDNGVDSIAVGYAFFRTHIRENQMNQPPKKKGKKNA